MSSTIVASNNRDIHVRAINSKMRTTYLHGPIYLDEGEGVKFQN